MKTLKDVLGEGLYNQALRECESLRPMGVSVKEMSRDDLVVSVALLIKAIQTHPTHSAELAAYAQSRK